MCDFAKFADSGNARRVTGCSPDKEVNAAIAYPNEFKTPDGRILQVTSWEPKSTIDCPIEFVARGVIFNAPDKGGDDDE